jgi:hypothetical protein
MLNRRPPSRPRATARTGRQSRPGTEDADRKRELRNARKRRLAARKAVGLACCNVEYDGVMLQFLLDHVSMDDGLDYNDDPDKIGKAVSAMWRESAYGTRK